MSWLGLGLGQFGSQLGEAKDIAQQWREREQKMRMERAQEAMQALLFPLQWEEAQKRIALMDAHKYVLEKGGEPGAVYEVEQDPFGRVLGQRKIIEPKEVDIKTQIGRLLATGDAADKALAMQLMPLYHEFVQAGHATNPLQDAQREFMEAKKSGDPKRIAQATEIYEKLKPPPQPTMNTLVGRMLAGDPNAKAIVDNLRAFALEQLHARGWAFGQGRLFGLSEVIDPRDGVAKLLDGFTVDALTNQGYAVTGTGRMPMNMIVGAEQLAAEHEPAFNQIMSPNGGKLPNGQPRYNLGGKRPIDAYDNTSDRLIFQKIMDREGAPAEHQIPEYISRVIGLAATQNLSPEGRALIQSLAQYSEVMGRLRSVLGQQATDKMFGLSAALLPGKWTPDSKYAMDQMRIVDAVIKRAIGIPAFSGMMPQAPGVSGPIGPPMYGPMSGGPMSVPMLGPGAGPINPGAGVTSGGLPPGAVSINLEDFLKEKK